MPPTIEFAEELPHTPAGRIRKLQLRQGGASGGTWDREAAGFAAGADFAPRFEPPRRLRYKGSLSYDRDERPPGPKEP